MDCCFKANLPCAGYSGTNCWPHNRQNDCGKTDVNSIWTRTIYQCLHWCPWGKPDWLTIWEHPLCVWFRYFYAWLLLFPLCLSQSSPWLYLTEVHKEAVEFANKFFSKHHDGQVLDMFVLFTSQQYSNVIILAGMRLIYAGMEISYLQWMSGKHWHWENSSMTMRNLQLVAYTLIMSWNIMSRWKGITSVLSSALTMWQWVFSWALIHSVILSITSPVQC